MRFTTFNLAGPYTDLSATNGQAPGRRQERDRSLAGTYNLGGWFTDLVVTLNSDRSGGWVILAMRSCFWPVAAHWGRVMVSGCDAGWASVVIARA